MTVRKEKHSRDRHESSQIKTSHNRQKEMNCFYYTNAWLALIITDREYNMPLDPYNIDKFAARVGKSNLAKYFEGSKNPTLDALLSRFLEDETITASSLVAANQLIDAESLGLTEDNIRDFHQIQTLFTEEGRCAINVACSNNDCVDLLALDLPNEELSMRLFNEYPDVFKQALMLHDVNDTENWKLYKASAISDLLANTDVSMTTFRNGVCEYLQSLHLSGTMEVTHLINGDRVVLDAYYAKNHENQWYFDDTDQLELFPMRKPLKITLDYNWQSGQLKLKTSNRSSVFESTIKDLFARSFLKKPKGLLFPNTNPIIELLPLVQKTLHTDPSDGISAVHITQLRFIPPDDKNEKVTIVHSSSGMMASIKKKGLVPEELDYFYASVRFVFSDKLYGRSRTIHLNARTNRINWTGDLHDQIIEKYLKRWGVLHV